MTLQVDLGRPMVQEGPMSQPAPFFGLIRVGQREKKPGSKFGRGFVYLPSAAARHQARGRSQRLSRSRNLLHRCFHVHQSAAKVRNQVLREAGGFCLEVSAIEDVERVTTRDTRSSWTAVFNDATSSAGCGGRWSLRYLPAGGPPLGLTLLSLPPSAWPRPSSAAHTWA